MYQTTVAVLVSTICTRSSDISGNPDPAIEIRTLWLLDLILTDCRRFMVAIYAMYVENNYYIVHQNGEQVDKKVANST